MRKTLLIILIFFLLTSCSVHTFTYGDGPKQGYTKVLKQHNYVGGLISDNTPSIEELNGETDYKLVVKHSIVIVYYLFYLLVYICQPLLPYTDNK